MSQTTIPVIACELLAADAPVERIAKLLGVSERSFHRHYKRDVEMALTEQVAILNTRLMAMTMGIARNANRGAVRAAIFTVDQNGDGKMIEIEGSAFTVVIGFCKALRERALEAVHGNRADANKLRVRSPAARWN